MVVVAAAAATITPGAAGRSRAHRTTGKDLGIEIVVFPVIPEVATLTAATLPLLVWEAEVGAKAATLL